jgi:hypothetical protein
VRADLPPYVWPCESEAAALRAQIRGALAWLESRPETPVVLEVMIMYREALKGG